MFGTYRINIILGLVGMVLTFIFAIQTNVLGTAFIRSLYSFLFMFSFTYLFRWMAALIFEMNSQAESEEEAESVGHHIDFTTPEEKHDEEDEKASFSPLSPPKYATTKENDPKKMAEAVRHITED